MKISIITFHFAHNQGAVLQCYALQSYLKKLGHDVYVINYRPPYHTVRYSSWKNPFLVAAKNWKKNIKLRVDKRLYSWMRGFARGIVANIKRTDSAVEQKFQRFITENLKQSKVYKSISELEKCPPDADVYIAGSDQLWNPDLLDYKFDPAYFMQFGDSNIRRITYAVSLKEEYSLEEKEQLKGLCSQIDALSIRERNRDLESVVNCKISVCIDPTLLLEEKDYCEIETTRLEIAPYVFVYGFETKGEIDAAVKTIATKLGIKVINGSPDRIRLSMQCIKVRDYGPGEFLSYIKYADFVVTNSFHGTAFSLIYKKNFVVIPHSTRGGRMKELLRKVGLEEKIWQDSNEKWEHVIDYSKVDIELQKLQKTAFEYLEHNIR